MAERFKAAVLKTVVGLNPPRVRIPVSPQKTLRKECFVVKHPQQDNSCTLAKLPKFRYY